jgi:hypothetical protein
MRSCSMGATNAIDKQQLRKVTEGRLLEMWFCSSQAEARGRERSLPSIRPAVPRSEPRLLV